MQLAFEEIARLASSEDNVAIATRAGYVVTDSTTGDRQ